MRYGLKDAVIGQINDVLAQYPPVEQAILYGSRAKGNYRPGSDIDLTLKGESLTLRILNRLDNQLDDLLLPYTFDLSLYQQIDNPNLLDHINRVGIIFYQKMVIRRSATAFTYSTRAIAIKLVQESQS